MRGIEEDARLELRLRLWAPPVVLGCAWLFTGTGVGRSLARVFSGMWLHELGHAMAAWWCGFFALPIPWQTLTSERRQPAVSVVLLAALIALGVWAQRSERPRLVWVAAGLVAMQAVLTLGVRRHTAGALMLFGGDAGAMVFGTALVATFFAPPGSKLQVSWLRWGFVVLGALAFFDVFRPWWQARHDLDAIPFGEIDGVGDSDPTRLVDEHGWEIPALVARYSRLGLVCMAAMAGAWVTGVLAARKRLAEIVNGG